MENDADARLEALKLAQQNLQGYPAEKIVRTAEEFYRFLTSAATDDLDDKKVA